MQRATLVCQAPRITAADLGLAAGAAQIGPAGAPALPTAPASTKASSDPERAELERILVESGGVVATAAALLGVSRQALYRRMDRLGVELERRPKT